MAYPVCAGLMMKTHRRTSWKSAAIVASPDKTLKAREPFSLFSGIIERRQKVQATSPAIPTAKITAASLDLVSPTVAAKARIPKAHASDNAIQLRKVLTGSVAWAGMYTPQFVHVLTSLSWEPNYGITQLLTVTGGTGAFLLYHGTLTGIELENQTNGTFTSSGGGTLETTPEPESIVLLGTGLASLLAYQKRALLRRSGWSGIRRFRGAPESS